MAKGAKVNLTEGKVSGHVLRMLGPFSIAVIALISTGIVDTIYLGRLTDAARPNLGVMALAAVGFAFPLTFLGNSANIGLGAGTMSAISRALGFSVFLPEQQETSLGSAAKMMLYPENRD